MQLMILTSKKMMIVLISKQIKKVKEELLFNKHSSLLTSHGNQRTIDPAINPSKPSVTDTLIVHTFSSSHAVPWAVLLSNSTAER